MGVRGSNPLFLGKIYEKKAVSGYLLGAFRRLLKLVLDTAQFPLESQYHRVFGLYQGLQAEYGLLLDVLQLVSGPVPASVHPSHEGSVGRGCFFLGAERRELPGLGLSGFDLL